MPAQTQESTSDSTTSARGTRSTPTACCTSPRRWARRKERLLFATFTEGHPIGDRDMLVKLAADVGVAESDARRVLDGDEFGREVREEEAEAMEMGATGVPFFLFDRRFAVSGAQPPETLLHVLERAWSEANPVEIIDDSAAACEGDACEM